MSEQSEQAHPPALQDKTVTLVSEGGKTVVALSRKTQLLGGAAIVAVLGWTVVATSFIVVGALEGRQAEGDDTLMRGAYEMRIASLTDERNELHTELAALESRFEVAMSTITNQKSELLSVARQRAEMDTALEVARAQLIDAVAERNRAEAEQEHLAQSLADFSIADQQLAQAQELDGALTTVSKTLASVARERDTAHQNVDELETEIASLELSMEIASERQEQMVASLEDAVEMTFKPLETMFERSGLDVDSLVSSIRPSYTGFGGASGPVSVSTHSFEDAALNERFNTLMEGMDKMNMMRIAATKVPYAMPVKASHRYTSGFGTRRDPKTGGRRAHNGIDLAGPRGTKILSTAEGVVVFAGRQSGFGNLIKIRHEFGFETLYAHLNRINVKVGDRIARGEHIGDMGTTGRSTGVHLHYEVRIGGKPVNPMTYIKAAKDVF